MSAPLTSQPWGKAAGLLVGCAVALCGVWRGMGPLTLLVRVGVAAVVTTLLVGSLHRTVQHHTPQDDTV